VRGPGLPLFSATQTHLHLFRYGAANKSLSIGKLGSKFTPRL
jgi:hypothetical protein